MSQTHIKRVLQWSTLSVIVAGSVSLFAQVAGDNNRGADMAPKAPIKARTAQEQAQTFVMPTGYRLEAVLSDPEILNPAVIEWDANGRMYVVEFITYMPNVEGDGQREPLNRITRFEDTNADGTYDKRTVFADRLVLPRMILPLQDGVILTNETDSDDVIKLSDTNGDGVADKREIFYSGVGLNRDGNLEHMQSGFVWGLDNWIYSTYNAFRFRWTPNGILREPTGNNGGQWGLTQDDDGKMWFVCAGCERGPLNFQVPIQYGAFRISPRPAGPNGPANTFDEYEPAFDIVWPLPSLADVQGGMGRVRQPIGAVNHATATAGPTIARTNKLPEDMYGDLFYAEPVGRLIRRAKIVKEEGLTQLRNAYPYTEFILSSDPLFRPVNMNVGPDGSIYIADMYRGIIQEAQWTGPGSYLRMKIFQYQLDKITSHGRIWRLRYDGTPEVPGTPVGPAASRPIPPVPATPAITPDFSPVRMYQMTSAQLVGQLSHPVGWHRDTAQRQLVLKQDKSVVPALQALVRSDNLLGRFHAMWTLEGLGSLDAALVREQMKDPNPRMRVQAIRASETLYKAGNKSFDADYRAATTDADPDVVIQAMLTLKVLAAPGWADVMKATMDANKARGVQEIGRLASAPAPAAGAGRGGPALAPEQQQLMDRGQTIYGELCYSCHGEDGRGTPHAGGEPGQTMAPPLAGSAHVQGHRDFVIKTVLHGLTGPNNGKAYSEVMIPMGSQKDDWVAAVGSYIRNSFGNSASFISPSDVARVRALAGTRKMPWTVEEIESTLPAVLQAQETWKFTASHNPDAANKALTTAGWSMTPQPNGWFQVELPEPVLLTEIQWTAPAGRGAGAGGRAGTPPAGAPVLTGRGGAPAGTVAAPATPAAPAAPAAVTTPARGRAGAAPAPELQVRVSLDGKSWSQPLAGGTPAPLTILAFTPTRAKFVRITRTPSSDAAAPWNIQTLRLFQAKAPAAR